MHSPAAPPSAGAACHRGRRARRGNRRGDTTARRCLGRTWVRAGGRASRRRGAPAHAHADAAKGGGEVRQAVLVKAGCHNERVNVTSDVPPRGVIDGLHRQAQGCLDTRDVSTQVLSTGLVPERRIYSEHGHHHAWR